MSIGVPIKVLHEAEGHTITCETNTGEVYRGKLIEAEDNMNCQMQNITVTYRDGREAQLENVYIRGSKIRFLILPDMLKNAPMFKRPGGKGSGTAGRGKSAILRAQDCGCLYIYGNVNILQSIECTQYLEICKIFKLLVEEVEVKIREVEAQVLHLG
ncbi:small nuclear ribonucleoprotein Sm D3 isoform X1 [Bombus huntii]|uniref:small nuclear ribonucleoprotein Sm D3 isoform X1 n=1 Tax=Bombus huntii TaxID=85661 RepID=UPI0021AAE319|nr:small nuclear ribonucleoprotein Sm D3 isoform X1 [Bombus huntii]